MDFTPHSCREPEVPYYLKGRVEWLVPLARAVLSRAISDIRMTENYGRMRYSGSSHIYSTYDAISIGEEVREWFSDTSDEGGMFSFRNVCDLAGRDYRDVLREVSSVMTPRNRHLARMARAEDSIIQVVASRPGISYSALRNAMRKRYSALAIRTGILECQERGDIVMRVERTIGRRVKRFYLNGKPHSCRDGERGDE